MKVKDVELVATGQYPRGKVDEHDEGELHMALAADHANAIVRLEFGTPVAWLGLSMPRMVRRCGHLNG